MKPSGSGDENASNPSQEQLVTSLVKILLSLLVYTITMLAHSLTHNFPNPTNGVT